MRSKRRCVRWEYHLSFCTVVEGVISAREVCLQFCLPRQSFYWLSWHPRCWPKSILVSVSFRSVKGRLVSRHEHCNPSSCTNEIISSSVLCRQEAVVQLAVFSILIVMANVKNSLECPSNQQMEEKREPCGFYTEKKWCSLTNTTEL